MFWELAATSPLLLGPLKLSKSATNVANSLFVTRSLEVCRNASDKSSAFSCLDAVTLHLIALSGVQEPPQFLKETKGLRFNIGVTSVIATGCDFSAKSLRNAMRCLGKFGCNVGPVGLIFFISSSGVFGITCRRTFSVLSQPQFPSFLKFPLVTHLHHHSQLSLSLYVHLYALSLLVTFYPNYILSCRVPEARWPRTGPPLASLAL